MGVDVYEPYASEPHVRSSRISAELQRLAPHYGFSAADNVVFARGLISATVDHVVVDRFGVLIIDAEPHEGAAILGTDTDTQWTATYSTGQVKEFRNPLYVNGGSENLVRQALADHGVNLEPAEVRSAVVFVGADISRLSLVEVNALKVRTAETIADIFESRYANPTSTGRLTGADIDRIMTLVAERAQEAAFEEPPPGPWSADPAVVAANRVAMIVPPPTVASGAGYNSTMQVELAGHHGGTESGPTTRSALLTLGTIVVIVLLLVAWFVFYAQLQSGDVTAWTATFVLLVALAELVSANIAAARRSSGKPVPGGGVAGVVRFIARLIGVALVVAAGWMFLAGGFSERMGESIANMLESRANSGNAAIVETPGVRIAKRRLRERAPRVYRSVTNRDAPSIHPQGNGTTSYTWSYTPQGASEATSFTITLDASGKVVSP